jgi:ABC-type branched-subunit amino acid transport system permease subunit
MRTRTGLLIITVLVLGLLAVGGTVGAMALTHSGFMGNNGYGHGMMNGQPYHGSMMGGYQQSPAEQGTPVTGIRVPTFLPRRIPAKLG